MMSVVDTMPMNRTERRRQQTRDQLMQAALELLMESGYQNLTIKAITDRADLGYGTFYLHFNDKDAIVWEVVHGLGESWRVEMEAKLEGIPFPRREYLSWVYLFEYVDAVREPFAEMMGRRGSVALLQYYQDYLAELHQDNLRRGIYRSDLDVPPEFLAQYLSGALVRLMLWWVETPNNYSPGQMADMLYETVYRQPPPR